MNYKVGEGEGYFLILGPRGISVTALRFVCGIDCLPRVTLRSPTARYYRRSAAFSQKYCRGLACLGP